MAKNSLLLVTVAVLMMASCGKSTNNASQMGTSANPPGANTSADQAAAPSSTAVPAQAPTQPSEPPPPFVLDAGTSLPVVLSTTINSYSAKPGQEFDATLAAPVLVNGEEAIPKGAAITGEVVDAKKQGTFKGEAHLVIRLTRIRVRGKEYPIATNTHSDTEKGKGKRTAGVSAGSTAGGALIGGLAGGGKGAGIGALVGAAGGLAVSGATGGKNAEFPAETRLTFTLSHSVTVER